MGPFYSYERGMRILDDLNIGLKCIRHSKGSSIQMSSILIQAVLVWLSNAIKKLENLPTGYILKSQMLPNYSGVRKTRLVWISNGGFQI
jgi:hypothetical protein